MPKKSIYTPKSRVKSALRGVWLRSRERARALKRENYCCESCGKKQSRAKGREVKIQVHHKDGILNWDEIMNAVYKHLLCPAENLEVLCVDCHAEKEKSKNNK
jgi:5-methylcytosine-specific restriction endonuclease McrA